MVITAAVLSVGAAISLGTIAATATAIVAVSAAVGVLGLGVGLVGMATGNEDLMKVGEIMGYVGIAGGLAGGLVGGLGGMMQGGAGFLAGAKGAYVGAGEKLAEAGGKYSSFFDDVAGAKVMGPTQEASTFTQAPGANPGIGQTPSTSMPGQAGNTLPGQGVGTGNYKMVPDPMLTGGAPTPPAPLPSTAGQIPTSQNTYGVMLSDASKGPSYFNPGVGQTPAVTNAVTAAPTPGLADGMPDWMKYSAVTAGMQGLTGMAGGMFQGESAEQQMELEKLKNAQDQSQRQLMNQRSSYAPRISFNRPGIIAR